MAYVGFNTVSGAAGEVIAFPGGFKDIYSAAIEHAPVPQRPFWELAEKREELQAVRGNRIIFTKMKPLTGMVSPVSEADNLSSSVMDSAQYFVDVQEYGHSMKLSQVALDLNNHIDIRQEAALLLGDHYHKNLNRLCRDAALSSGNVLYPNGKATPGSLIKGSDTLSTDLLEEAREALVVNMAPRYRRMNANGLSEAYVYVAHPHVIRQLRSDPEFMVYNNHYQTAYPLTGEIGMWHGIVFVETPAMPCGMLGSGEEAYDATLHAAGSDGSDLYTSVLLGAGAFGFAAAGPVEMRQDTPEDYGRRYGFAWRRMMGTNIFNPQYAMNLITT